VSKKAVTLKIYQSFRRKALLSGQSAWLVNYAERHRAGLRVGPALTEGTANFLVNRRMNKSQQMRWSRRGADLLLQVRCAVYNGTLGSDFGQKFQPTNDPSPPMAITARPQTLRQSHWPSVAWSASAGLQMWLIGRVFALTSRTGCQQKGPLCQVYLVDV
jgi:hypothetical protein